MSSGDGFLTSVISALSAALAPLADPGQLAGMLTRLGWPVPVPAQVAGRFTAAAAATERLAADIGAGASAVTLAADVAGAISALDELRAVAPEPSAGPPFDDPAFWATLPEELLGLLIAEALQARAPGAYGVLSFLGVLTTSAAGADPATGRAAYTARAVDWAALIRAATAPQALMRNVYGWGGDFDHGRFLAALGALGAGIGAATELMPLHRALAEPFVASDNPDRLAMKQLVIWPFLVPGPALAASVQPALIVTPLTPAGTPSARPDGMLLAPTLTGSAGATIGFRGGAVLSLTGDLQASPQRLGLRPGSVTREQAAADGDLEARIDIAPPEPVLLGGAADGSRFELARAHLSLAATGTGLGLVVEIEAGLDDATAVLDLSGADSFVRGLLGDARYELPVALLIQWSSDEGLRFSGSALPAITIPVGLLLGGVLSVSEIQLALGSGQADGAAELAVTATGSVLLGPFSVSFDRLGALAEASIASFSAAGNFGLVDVALGFKPPDGLGLAIDTDVVSGGGYLAIDGEAGTYQGIIDLQIVAVGVSAVMIVDTGAAGPDGWSMLSALFIGLPSIPLGFGFTLQGVGGLAGVNRTLDTAALSSAVSSGALDAALFPADPVADAPVVIADLSDMFPASAGRYVFAPVVKIGWGTSALVTGQLGIVVSLPDPIVIAVLGSISSVLPSDDVSLVVLHLDVSGVIDAAAGTLAIDASLHDSDIVGFALAGDMALRAAFSGEPSLLMALGGFHPGFEPPADFPQLARLSLGLSAPPVIDVQLECYLAVTSNTVQFGARVELRASVAGFGIDGDTEFDALVQFSPFLVSTQLGFHVTVTAASVGLAGVWLDASVEGPNPWHIVGTACFRLLGLDEEVRIDERIGAPVPEAAAAGADPLSLIRTALAAPEAWSAPVTTSPGVVLAAASADAPAAAAELAAMPDGLVAVSQGAVPLGVTLDKVGDAPPGDYDLFEVEPAGASVSSSGQLQDWFAPGTFFELERSELLASPSFELLKSGIEFGGGEPTAGPDLACSLDFEQILRDPGNGEDRVELGDEPPPSGAQALVATGRLPAGGFATAPAGQPVTMAADGWAVTDRDSGAVLARTASWSRAHQSDQGRRAATTIVPAWEAPE